MKKTTSQETEGIFRNKRGYVHERERKQARPHAKDQDSKKGNRCYLRRGVLVPLR
jgi:hypothetical protein